MRRQRTVRPPAYVLGPSLNALGVLRSLGRRGIRVRAIQTGSDGMVPSSRYNSSIRVEPTATKTEYLETLIKTAKHDGERPVLIPTGDVDLEFMSDNQDVLRNYFQFVLSDAQVLNSLLKKEEFYHLALKMTLPVPKTYFANDLQKVRELSCNIAFPCVIKPRYSPSWKLPWIANAIGYVNVFECRSAEELLSRYASLPPEAREVVIQDMIPGDEDHLFDVYAYVGSGGVTVASFTLQKLRTEPIAGRGGGTLVQSVHETKLTETSISFLRAIGFRGPAAVCFKRHSRTNQFIAIEVNARLSLHHTLAARCGIDFAYFLYLDSIGDSMTPKFDYCEGVKWIAALYDARAFLEYSKEDRLSFRNWLLSYRGPKTFADWSWDDPWPFIKECLIVSPSVARKFWSLCTGLYSH